MLHISSCRKHAEPVVNLWWERLRGRPSLHFVRRSGPCTRTYEFRAPHRLPKQSCKPHVRLQWFVDEAPATTVSKA